MKIIYTFIIVLLLLTCTSAQEYKQVKIFINDKSDVQSLYNAGIDIDHVIFTKDNAIEVFVSSKEFEILENSGYKFEVLIDDWFTYFNQLPQLNEQEIAAFKNENKDKFGIEGFGYGSMGGFYTLQEVYNKLDTMFIDYPNIITQKFQIGTSIENRPLYAVKISDNPNIDEDEPEVHYNALIHAREPQAMMTVMYYMFYLLENYGTNPEVTYLVNNRELFFVPVINVDGYEYNRSTNPNGGGMWRKNRRVNAGGSYGVDLNRNFGYQWGYDNNGSSGTPSSETYRGTAAFSEPESQAIRNLFNQREFKAALNYHTYGNYLIHPWGYVNQQPPVPDNQKFWDICSDMTSWNGYQWGNSSQVLYPVNGSTDDWMYGEQITKPKIFAMTPEVGPSFWPSQSQIFPLAQINLNPNLYLTWVAGDFVALKDPGYNKPYFVPGDTIAIQPFYLNKGLSTSSPLNVQLTSLNGYATVFADNIPLDTIAPGAIAQTFMPAGMFLSSSTPIEEEIKFVLALREGTTVIRTDTISFIVGVPSFVFTDTTNNINTLWTITSTPLNPKWAATTSTFHSAPNSYTDSPTGNYSANATVVMTLTNALNLSSYSHPLLTYWTKYDLESGWDYGQVEISTNNGSSWIPMAGQYTTIGSGSFQPPGQPLYNGTRLDWVKESIDLTNYNANQFKVRFELKSDGSVQDDGWYLDDIGIMVYAAVPVELTSFTARNNNGSVLVNWSTATELNNNGFEIERVRADAKGNPSSKYTVLGFIKGNGTTEVSNNYRFVDDNPVKGISYYRLKQYDYNGSYRIYGPVKVEVAPVYTYMLEQNYPNPFNPSTTINYSIAENSFVTIEIYNIIGQKIASLVNAKQEAGSYSVTFDGNDYNLSNGVYIYKLKAGNFSSNKKMILMK